MTATPKIFGRLSLSAATSANLFSSPASGATFSVRIVNTTGGNALVQLSLSDTTATQQTSGRLVPDDIIVGNNGFLELTGLTIESGIFCVIESDVANVTAIAYGMEG